MPRTWLMATHDGPRTDTEAEDVLVEHDGKTATLTFDDGDEWTFDRMELLRALDAGDAVAEAKANAPGPLSLEEQRAMADELGLLHGGKWSYAGRDDDGQPVFVRDGAA